MAFDKLNDPYEYTFGLCQFPGSAGDQQLARLPNIVVIDLCYRDIEFPLQADDHRFDPTPFVFE